MNMLIRINKKMLLSIIPIVIFPFLLSSCGGGSSNAPNTTSNLSISGTATKGPISGATVTVYQLNTNGSYGTALGSGTTDSSGKFNFSLTTAPNGPVAIVITNGSYTSESTSSSVKETSPMCAMQNNTSSGITGLSVTPLSDMACARAESLANSGTSLNTAITSADTFIMKIYGLTAPPEKITPTFTTTALPTDSGRLALVLAAFDKLRASGVLGTTGDDIYAALSKDISDGLFDGFVSGIAVPLSGTTSGTLPFTAGSSDFVSALAAVPPAVFGATSAAQINIYDSSVTSGLAEVSPSSVGLASSSSGAMSTLAIAGHQYLYVAARSKGVEKVDVTNPTAPKVLTSSDGWAGADTGAGSLLSHFSSGEVGGAQIISGLTGGPQLLVFAYGDPHIALVNPDTGAITWEGDMTFTNGPYSFSGGSAYIAGAIPVLGSGAWLATTDGYEFFDASATLAAGSTSPPVIGSTVYPIDSSQSLSENLGGDIEHGILFAPNYGGIQLINLTANSNFPVGSYTLDTSAPGIPSSSPVLSGNFDAGSVDSHLQVGILTYEDSNYVSFIDLNNIVPSSSNMFAPATTNGIADVQISSTSILSGSAVDPLTDQALFMAGFSNDLVVGQLQNPTSITAGETWNGMSDWVDYTLGSSGNINYSYATDPHADAVINIAGKSYGYLLNGSSTPTGIVQIDMSALLAMSRAGTTGDAAHQPATDPTVTGGPITSIAFP